MNAPKPSPPDAPTPVSSSPIWFPQWEQALQRGALVPIHKRQYRVAILRYLRFLKETHQPATVETAHAFMMQMEASGLLGRSLLERWKQALNWFFKQGQRHNEKVGTALRAVREDRTTRWAGAARPTGHVMTDVPPTAAADLGETDWEKKLIRALRSRHCFARRSPFGTPQRALPFGTREAALHAVPVAG